MVYEELKRLARRLFQSEAPGHTLQPTALVNEAFSSLVRSNVSLNDRAHFYALCARMMRRILVNHALKRKAVKRGSGATHVSLDDAPVGREDKGVEVLADADERKARLLELHYFGGLTYDELASTMSLSSSQIHRDLRAAKAWLKVRLAA
jgi:RNA polymerase sigma factor (TIGR02999 family)